MTSYKKPVFILFGFLAWTLIFALIQDALKEWFRPNQRDLIMGAGYVVIVVAAFVRR